MRLEIVEEAIQLLKKNRFRDKVILFLINLLEKYFDSEILVKIPEGLVDFDKNLFSVVNLAIKLKKVGYIEKLTQLKKYPDEPFIYYYSSKDRKSGGGHFFNEKDALQASLGESVERYLWFYSDYFYKNNLIFKSYKEIKNQALNIFDLAGFSDEQKKQFDILKFDENTIFGWTKIFSLTRNRYIFCPVQLLSALYFSNYVRKKKEPMLRWAITTGLTTSTTLKGALTKAFLEIIERDAFMITWLNKISPPIIDLEYLALKDQDIAQIKKTFERYNLELYVLKLISDFPVFVLAAIIIDRTGLGPAFAIGARADFDLKNALINCVSEALAVRYSLKERFLNDIDLKNIKREERLIYYAQKENLSKVEFLIQGEKIQLDLNNFPDNPDEKFKILMKEFRNKNYEVCYAELTTPEIKKLGLRVVNMVIPELQPLHLEESIPYFGGKRLKEVPLKLGYQPAEILNQDPHPFP